MAYRALVFLVFSTLIQKAHSAGCCGGGAGLPNLITGDYRGQISLVGTNAAITHSADEDQQISARDASNQEVTESATFSAAYLLSPLWQVGFSLPYKYNTHRTTTQEESTSGVADPSLMTAYEFLPEYGFSWWRPKGYIFIEQSFANSNSTYDSQKPLRTDSISSGFSTTSIGVALTKILYQYDFLFMGQVHKGHSQNFQQNNESFTVRPSLGQTFLFGAGISPSYGTLRIGTTLQYNYEGEKKILGNNPSTALSSYYWEVGINISYKFEEYSLIANYRDQSFLGKASNTTLAKSLGVSFVKFFEL